MESSEETLIEESEFVYHNRVAKIQLDAQRQKEEYMDQSRAEQDRYTDTHLDVTVEKIAAAFEEIIATDMENIREVTRRLISMEFAKLQERNRNIHSYVLRRGLRAP